MGRLGDVQDDSSSSDELPEETEIPRHMLRERKHWERLYEEELEGFYRVYLEYGRSLFGSSFHQLGSVSNFMEFVFRYMQPGAS